MSLRVRAPSGEQTIGGSDTLVAAGRSPNTVGIGLDVAGVELDGGGYVKVNERLTTRPARADEGKSIWFGEERRERKGWYGRSAPCTLWGLRRRSRQGRVRQEGGRR